jgi:uncharacterized membrane protein
MIVHFPVAIIITGFLAEVLSLFIKSEKCLSKTGFYLMILGALAAIAAWATGQFFTGHPAEGAMSDLFKKHQTSGFITMLLMIVGSAFRIFIAVRKLEDTGLKWIAFAFYFLAFVSVAITGYIGGTMVYDYMMSL